MVINTYFKLILRKWKSGLYHVRYFLNLGYERARGLDLSGPMSLEKAGIAGSNGSFYYASSGFFPTLSRALAFSNINKEDTIIDYGCGKGAALIRFSQFPFRRIAGLELSSSLASICRQNLDKLKLSRVEVIEGNASTFIDIDDFNYFYFFNPFSEEIFRLVLDRLAESLKRKKRKIIILYTRPKCHELINSSSNFVFERKFSEGEIILNIYSSKETGEID